MTTKSGVSYKTGSFRTTFSYFCFVYYVYLVLLNKTMHFIMLVN